MAIGIAATLGLAAGGSRPAEAAFTFALVETGADVVATGSGSLDLGAGVSRLALSFGGIDASQGIISTGGTIRVFSGLSGPASFGTGGFVSSSSRSGDAVLINGSQGTLGVPFGYVSGSALSNSLTFAGQSFATLGLTPGTYTWTLGGGATADSITVQIGPVGAAVPEPAAALLLGAGLLGLAAVRRRGRDG